jgi:hypothetical protein
MKTFILLFTVLTSSAVGVALPQIPGLPNLTNLLLETLGLNGVVGIGAIPILETTVHSPECANLNNGTYVCCESTFNGDLPIVVEASALTDYPLTKNSINGLIGCEWRHLFSLLFLPRILSMACLQILVDTADSGWDTGTQSFTSCYPGTELCCGVIDLVSCVFHPI